MKSRHQPLDPNNPETVGPDADATAADAVSSTEITVDPAEELGPLTPEPQRPMSERRRRRLAEEQRQAQQRAAEAARMAAPATEVAPPPLAPASTATPPAPYEAPPAPSLSRTRADERAEAAAGRQAYLIAGIASALWIGGVASWFAYEAGAGLADMEPLRLAVYVLIALAPAGLAIMLAHAVRQGAGLAAETRRARRLADAMVAPTALAAEQAGQLVTQLRTDIDQAALATERARNDMALLREALADETTRLNEAAEVAGRTARRLSEQLGRERDSMQALGIQLDSQATGVIDAVERQSRMVADASDLAQTQLREAEAALAARAADLAAAATEAQDAARLAADDLARQTLRLENAGSGVAEQIQSVEEGLGQQRAALVTAAYALRTDQEDFSAQVESQRAQLAEQLSATRTVAGELDDVSSRSSEAIRELVASAADQFRALIEMSAREADGFDAATRTALDRFESLAADARDALVEETRRALAALQATADEARLSTDEAASHAQVRADRLGEVLFEAAQKADFAADTRIEGARRIVQDTAALVDEAGERAVERLESTIARMTTALEMVEATMVDLDARAARLPEDARARMDEVRATVEEGLNALTAASRKAAEDTEALDIGFQERVRRNYDMLTEAVRLMGVVSGDTPTSPRRREPLPPLEPESPAARARPVAPPPAAPSPAASSAPRPAAPISSAPSASAPAEEPSRGFGLRGRLKLEPAGDEARRSAKPAEDDGLDWRDLVEDGGPTATPLDLDRPVTSADADDLADRITAAIRRMGVDPNALLPRSRVEEAAAAFEANDPDQARHIVRRIAPAAVRSVSRRVLSDAELKADAELYVRGFAHRLLEAPVGGGVLTLLATDAGRAFMLLDAAIGDLT